MKYFVLLFSICNQSLPLMLINLARVIKKHGSMKRVMVSLKHIARPIVIQAMPRFLYQQVDGSPALWSGLIIIMILKIFALIALAAGKFYYPLPNSFFLIVVDLVLFQIKFEINILFKINNKVLERDMQQYSFVSIYLYIENCLKMAF